MFALAGCMPAMGKKTDAPTVSKSIIKGKTTKQEIMAMYGKPYAQSFGTTGEEWVYVYQSRVHSLSFLTGIEVQELSIVFSGNMVKDYTFSTRSTKGG